MRLGKVEINYGYVVDLDDEEMVDHAKESIFQDMFNAYKYDNVESYIECDNESINLIDFASYFGSVDVGNNIGNEESPFIIDIPESTNSSTIDCIQHVLSYSNNDIEYEYVFPFCEKDEKAEIWKDY